MLCVLSGLPAQASTFVFSNSNSSGLNGLAAGNVADAEVTVSFVAGPGTAVFATDAGRLGVDSRSNPGVVDPFPNRLNLMRGTAAGQGESLSFSFNRTGYLDKLYFDGMKDETLEYFTLTLPNGSVRTIFDFEAEFRLNFQGFDPSDVGVPNFTMTDDASDDISGLGIPFRPGQVFTLTYGQVDYAALLPGYVPMNSQGIPTGDIANGARFEGLSVTLVPEPGTLAMLVGLVAVVVRRSRR
jgi:hypothetical protein